MKFIITLSCLFVLSFVSAFSQLFTPFVSGDGYPHALDMAEQKLGETPKLIIIGHFLGTLNLTYAGNPVEMQSGFDLETGKANYWVYKFTNGEISLEIGVLNSPFTGGFSAMELDVSDYLNLDAMADLSADLPTENMMGSEDLNQHFSTNQEFMTKYQNLKENYVEGYMGYYVNGPVSEMDKALYWGFWFIKSNGDADICAYNIDSQEMGCITHTSIEDEYRKSNISVAPNPASEVINIDNTEFATEYTISNYYGEIVLRGKLSHGLNTLNINNLASGMYFVQLSNDSGMIKAEKIIVK